jgi:hypothetical protein
MAAVTELANDVGTSAACQALCMPRASYYRDRRKTSFPAVTASRPRRHAHSTRWNKRRCCLACTKNASKIARPPLFMRRCSMKGNITARFEPCSACSNGVASPANKQRLCFALACGTVRTQSSKSDSFGLANNEGNHGEDDNCHSEFGNGVHHAPVSWLVMCP